MNPVQEVIDRLTEMRERAHDAAPKQANAGDQGYFQGKTDAFDIAIQMIRARLQEGA